MTTILIIDDAQILAVYRDILEREEYQVVESVDGDRGIQICREQAIDLVTTDIMMPGKEGLETILELRQEFPNLGIIAVSGDGHLSRDSYLPLAKKWGPNAPSQNPLPGRSYWTPLENFLKLPDQKAVPSCMAVW